MTSKLRQALPYGINLVPAIPYDNRVSTRVTTSTVPELTHGIKVSNRVKILYQIFTSYKMTANVESFGEMTTFFSYCCAF